MSPPRRNGLGRRASENEKTAGGEACPERGGQDGEQQVTEHALEPGEGGVGGERAHAPGRLAPSRPVPNPGAQGGGEAGLTNSPWHFRS